MAKLKPTPEPTSSDPRVAAEVARNESLDAHLMGVGETPADPVHGVPVWSVEIPGCLVGRRLVQADDEQAALAAYKAVCGITAHDQPAIVGKTDFDSANLPEGVELFG